MSAAIEKVEKVLRLQQSVLRYMLNEAQARLGMPSGGAESLAKTRIFRATEKLDAAEELLYPPIDGTLKKG